MTIFYSSNDAAAGFDATSLGTSPTGWTAKVGSWQVGTTLPTGAHTHSFGATSRGDGDVAILSGAAARADMHLSYTQKLATLGAGAAPMIGALLRMDGAYANGYAVLVDQTGALGALHFLVFRRSGGGYSLIGNSAAISGIAFSATDTVSLRVQIQGSVISAKLWPTRVSEPPNWQYTVTDGTVTAPGFAGLYYALDGSGAVSMAVSDVVLTDAASISVSTPTTTTAGTALTVSGVYTGPDPTGLNAQFDGAGFSAVSAPTIAGSSFQFTAVAPAVGAHTVSVQAANNTSAVGVSGTFNTATAGPSLTIVTPGMVYVGQAMVLTGTYSGTVPTGLNYSFDGAPFTLATSATIGGGIWSISVGAPSFGTHSVTIQETNAPGTVATSGSFVVALPPSNSGLLYSPLNWNIQPTFATTLNPGAWFRTLFSGGTCVMNFDVSGAVTPASQIWWRIDNGPWTASTVAMTVTCSIPAATMGNSDVPFHLLEVVVKSVTETQNRWNAGPSGRVVFAGLTLGNGASVALPGAAPRTVLVYGDSIAEGVRTLGESAANDTDRNDARMGWALGLAVLLGAEVGVVGFGGQGISVGGSGNVPTLGSSWNQLYAGVSRNFQSRPDLVVINIGTNDGGTDTVAAMTTLLNNISSACPGTPVAVVRPFNGAQAANLQAAVAACANPGACRFVDSNGMFSTSYGADSLNLHPSGPNNVGLIAPALAVALRPLIAGSGAQWFRPILRLGLSA